MKITKKQLKQIIKEEIGSAMSEGGAKPVYVPFADAVDPAHPTPADIEAETQKLAQAAGISLDKAKAMVDDEEEKAKTGEDQPIGEQAMLLKEDPFEIIIAVFANLFAELGFNVATHKSHQRRGPERTSLRSEPEPEPEAETGWDSDRRKWSKKFLEDYEAGKLTPEQYAELERFAEKGWHDRRAVKRDSPYKGPLPGYGHSDLMLQQYRSKHGDPRQPRGKSLDLSKEPELRKGAKWPRLGIPKGTGGVREMKITKKQLKRIIQEEIGRVLNENQWEGSLRNWIDQVVGQVKEYLEYTEEFEGAGEYAEPMEFRDKIWDLIDERNLPSPEPASVERWIRELDKNEESIRKIEDQYNEEYQDTDEDAARIRSQAAGELDPSRFFGFHGLYQLLRKIKEEESHFQRGL